MICLHKIHARFAVKLRQADLDELGSRGGNVFADIIGPYGQLAMAAVYQHRKLDAARSPRREYGFNGGSRRAAGVEHVINEDNIFIVHIRAYIGLRYDRLLTFVCEIVAVKADINAAAG